MAATMKHTIASIHAVKLGTDAPTTENVSRVSPQRHGRRRTVGCSYAQNSHCHADHLESISKVFPAVRCHSLTSCSTSNA